MKNRTKAFIAGAGSILCVFPATSYSNYVPSKNANERMRSYWESAGLHIKKASSQFQEDNEEASASRTQ